MKNIIYLVLLVLLLPCCNVINEKRIGRRIREVEQGLLPAVITNEDTIQGMNINDRMKYYHVPGVSIAVINNGMIEWAKGYGYFSIDSIREIDVSTRFQAASISKPVAAAAALTMVEAGLLDPDTDVNRYLVKWKVPENEFTFNEKVTLRRLISHTAGLTVHGFRGYAFNEEVPGTIQVLNGEEPANSPPVLPDTIPGSVYRYSGGGFTVMQQMLCDVTGESFPEIMYDRVLSKLGMDNSTYLQPFPPELSHTSATAHLRDGSPIEGSWHTYPEMAAAGLWTTPTDLAKFAIEIQKSVSGESNIILSRETVRQMLTEEKAGYGLGLALGGVNDSTWFRHGGSNAGFKCDMAAFTKLGKGAVIMTNGDRGGSLISEIYRSLSKVYGWNIFKPVFREIIYPGDEVLKEYTGTYEFEPDYSATIEVSNNALLIKQLWNEVEYLFLPEKRDTFFNKESNDDLIFKRNQDGEIIEFELAGTWKAKRTG